MDIVLGATGNGANGNASGAGDSVTIRSGGHVQVASNPYQQNHHHHDPFATVATSQASLSHEDNGPILYDEPNRTSAIDDIRSGVIYAFIFTLFFTFFLILPGIRNEKFPTILCIVPSLLVASIIVISIFGTTWHVGEAPNISAAYKAFSRDRIQGELNVRIGLNSVNISLRAYKYYVLHATDGPIIMENMATLNSEADGSFANIEKLEEQFGVPAGVQASSPPNLSPISKRIRSVKFSDVDDKGQASKIIEKSSDIEREDTPPTIGSNAWASKAKARATIKRLNVDINYNERFYWIEPQQMRHEYYQALERGLPYPILTVVEYLSQDEAGFNWSRQYRSAGYYASILLWLSFCVCILMFCLHCATPKYGIHTMQLLGVLLLFTNLIYAMLVPRGERELVIPFEGQSLRFRFGWNFWLVLIGGCISLVVGTMIAVVNYLKPNFIFTTVLDVDFDRNYNRSRQRQKCLENHDKKSLALEAPKQILESSNERHFASRKPRYPPFMSALDAGKLRSLTKQQQNLQIARVSNESVSSQTPKNRKRNSGALDANPRGDPKQDSIDVRL